ncbi:MAG: hypothetical protein FWE06_10155, partial [Oscillospiraceae bacterium]|nr:hypothetical protein [Oscillospiraceae bacterium]
TPIETPLPERPILSQERELEIVESFREWAWPLFAGRSYVCEQELAHSLERGYLEYYFGTFNGREALGIFVPFGADLATMRENVAGYSFVFPDLGWYFVHSDSFDGRSDGGVHIWLHDDGDWMCFCVGYERGYLTAEDIGLIWALYENRAALWHYEDRAW